MNNIKRIISFCLIFIMCFSIITINSTKEAKAALSVSKVTDKTNINSKYSFATRYIPGVTKLETFGGSSYASDVWITSGINIPKDAKSIRIKNATQKGKIGVWYRNVGEYEGEMLDLKITVMDWKEIRKPVDVTVDGKAKKSYPCVFFGGRKISISNIDKMIKKPKFRFEYFNQSGKKLKISGHQTFKDIDLDQYLESASFVRGYLSNDTELKVSGNKVYSDINKDMSVSDKKFWFTGVFADLDYYDVVFSTNKTDNMDFKNSKLTYRDIDTFTITGDSLAPFTTPTPKKSGTRYVHKGNVVKYNINFTVPQQPDDYRYEMFKIKDVLPKGIKYKSFKVTNDAGADVTNLFNATINGQTFTASVINPKNSSFYYKSYNLELRCEADIDFDYSSLNNNGGKVEVRNKASVISKAGPRPQGTKDSNEVLTEIRFKIITATDGNGTITNSIDNISGGSDRTISYTPNEGYELSKIEVDGRNIKINENNKNSFSFNKIYDNHKIKVMFKPISNNKIIVHKKIRESDFYKAYGNPIAIFRCEGTDINNIKHVYYKAVELNKNDLVNGYYIKSVTFDNLASGKYSVTEVKTSRYSFEEVKEIKGAIAIGSKLECNLINNRVSEGSFTNKLSNYRNFSHNDLIINNFK